MWIREESMSRFTAKTLRLMCLSLFGAISLVSALAEHIPPPQAVPPNFNADAAFAEEVRANVLPSTQPAIGRYATGQQVLERLIEQLPPGGKRYSWELRIAKDSGNVLSSPDGAIFVDEALAQFFGTRDGLWAAALSHEIVHVIRRDWARRYLFRRSLQESPVTQPVKGFVDASGSTWADSITSPGLFAAFCQSLELAADAEGLMLMARAGYHPDFMPALYHLLQGSPMLRQAESLDSSHPRWEERYEKLQPHLIAAGKEFSRLWPAPYASPGGNPPVVVYAGAPSVHRSPNGELEVQVHVHCDNMYGGAGVTLRLTATHSNFVRELHGETGCTSNNTVLRFTLAGSDASQSPMQGMVTVIDNQGDLVTRWAVPKPIR